MAQITRDSVDFDLNSVRRAPQISGLHAGEDGIKKGMPCRVDANGDIVRSNGTNADVNAQVDGFALRDADQGEPLTLAGEGTRIRYSKAGSLTPPNTLFLAAADGELDNTSTTGDSVGIARAISSEEIIVQNLGPR
jgi:hypothetical protein